MAERAVLDWSKPLPEYAFLPREGTDCDPMEGLEALVQELLSKTGQNPQTPVLMGYILEAVNIHYDNVQTCLFLSSKGRITTCSKRLPWVVYLQDGLDELERRVTLAHEIAHTLFHYLDIKDGEIKHVPVRSDFTDRDEEDFCESFAFELLKPETRAYRMYWEEERRQKIIGRAYHSCQLSLDI